MDRLGDNLDGGIYCMDESVRLKMPIRPENKDRYPKNWKEIRKRILKRARNQCEWCDAKNHEPHPITGSEVVLTIAHMDHTPENCDPKNLRAMCQRCHLRYDRHHHAATARKTRETKRLKREPLLPMGGH